MSKELKVNIGLRMLPSEWSALEEKAMDLGLKNRTALLSQIASGEIITVKSTGFTEQERSLLGESCAK